MTQRAVRASKKAIQTTIKATKVASKATIQTIKAIVAATKALISAIVAGGWVAVVIILLIVLIGGFIAAIFNSEGDENFDTSQIPNSEAWCACYVSWCANECGHIEKGIIPKYLYNRGKYKQ